MTTRIHARVVKRPMHVRIEKVVRVTVPVDGVSDHGALTGLGDDDHPQYHTDARGDARYAATDHAHAGVYDPVGAGATEAAAAVTGHETTHDHSQLHDHANKTTLDAVPDHAAATDGQALTRQGDGSLAWETPSGSGVSDHGALTGLAGDDHPQYHTDARGDARYAATDHAHAGVYDPVGAGATEAAAAVTGHETTHDHSQLHDHANKATLDAVPDHAAATDGQALTRQGDGSLAWETPSGSVPDASVATDGDVLTVQADNSIAWEAPSGGSGVDQALIDAYFPSDPATLLEKPPELEVEYLGGYVFLDPTYAIEDTSGNDRHGDFSGNTGNTKFLDSGGPGPLSGKCFDNPGNDEINIVQEASPPAFAEWTLMFWVYFHPSQPTSNATIFNTPVDVGERVTISRWHSGGRVSFGGHLTSTGYLNGYLPDDTWVFLACTYKHGYLYYYVDGVLLGSLAITYGTPTAPVEMGRRDGSYRMNGRFADVRVFSKALKTKEIEAYYRNRMGPFYDVAGSSGEDVEDHAVALPTATDPGHAPATTGASDGDVLTVQADGSAAWEAAPPHPELERQILLLNWRLAETDARTYDGLTDSVTDTYEDASGIDDALSSGYGVHADGYVEGSSDGGNIATGGTPISGGDYDGARFPANAFDGNEASYWGSSQLGAAVAHSAWVGYNFGAPRSFYKVRYLSSSNSGQLISAVDVDYSNDGVVWTLAKSFTIPETVSTWHELILDAPVTAQYVRLLARDSVTDPLLWSVWEMQVFGAEGWTNNKATGGTPVSGGDFDGYPAANAFDDDDNTLWVSSQTGAAVNGAAWIGYDLGTVQTVNRLLYRTPNAASGVLSAIDVEVSDDGVAWTLAQSFTGLTTALNRNVELPLSTPVNARYVRMLARGGLTTGNTWVVPSLSVYLLQDITLVSIAQEAGAEPVRSRILLPVECAEAFTVNTDLLADVSKDDGATWEAVTLASMGSWGADKTLYTGDVDHTVTGDQTMRYRVRTANSKPIKLHGASHLWTP